MKDLCVLILAAGKGTRMVSNRAKVLHRLCGRPMLQLVYNAAAGLEPDQIFVVIGQDAEEVRASLGDLPAQFVLQSDQLGTGHAVIVARDELCRRTGDVVVVFGDAPRIKTTTLRTLAAHHRLTGAATTLLTTRASEPCAYGRILRDEQGNIQSIIEEKDATPDQRKICEINPGFWCFHIPELMDSLRKLSTDNVQKEYYITDIVGIQTGEGKKVETVFHEDFEELRGINTRQELAELSLALGREKNLDLMASGVTLLDPDRTYVDLDVVAEKDVVLYPMVTLEGKTYVGEGTVIR